MKKYIYITIAMFTLSVACDKSFTEVKPNGVLSLDGYFEDAGNAEQALIGLYDLMQFNYARDWSSVFFLKQLPGDASNCGGPVSADQPGLQEIDSYATAISNPHVESIWNLFYRTIALSNTIINDVEKGSLSNKDAILAEAKFMRAWSYFELTTMFGAVPLRLTNPTKINSEAFAKAKSSRADIYVQVKSDLTAAISGLASREVGSRSFRVSKGTAQALMGKVLVFEGKNTEAIPFLESAIADPAYGLEDTPAAVWSVASEFGKESFFELGYISTNGVDWGNVNWGGRVESNLHVQLMGPRGDGFFDVAAVGLLNGWGFNLPTAKLVTAFENSGDVARKAATVMTQAELEAAGGSYDESKNHWDYEGAIRTKYATKLSDTNADGVTALNYTVNWRVFRYAEVLLLAAEAYNATGQDDKARAELNKVRTRAGLANIDATLSGTALFDAIVNEKYLELAHEGQRFWDLVRWGRASQELSGFGYTSKNDLFPIPAAEIDKNNALTIADQNPGY